MAMPLTACTTGILVWPASRSTIMLSCVGSRCWTRINAIPVSAGNALSSFVHASNPPAEAPIATMVKSGAVEAGLASASGMTTQPRLGRRVAALVLPWRRPAIAHMSSENGAIPWEGLDSAYHGPGGMTNAIARGRPECARR